MKRITFALVLTLVLASVSTSAYAEVLTHFSATAPTHYEGLNGQDGDPIDPDDEIEYMLYCGLNSGVYTAGIPTTQAFVNGGEDLDVSFCVTSADTYYFVATAWSVKYGTESRKSNETTRTYVVDDLPGTPMAPVLLSVGP